MQFIIFTSTDGVKNAFKFDDAKTAQTIFNFSAAIIAELKATYERVEMSDSLMTATRCDNIVNDAQLSDVLLYLLSCVQTYDADKFQRMIKQLH